MGISIGMKRVNELIIVSGDIMLYAGGQQPGQKRKVPSNVLSGKLHIQGSIKLPKYSNIQH